MSKLYPDILPFTAIDGDNLVVHAWPLANDHLPPRAGVLLLHTLEEYGMREAPIARFLVEKGFAVRSFDMYGHGTSDGTKGKLPPNNRFVTDIADMIDEFKRVLPKGIPIVLFGTGFSAVLCGHVAVTGQVEADSIIMSSPSFENNTTWWQRILLSIMPKVAPNMIINASVNPNHISHSQEVVREFKNDSMRHTKLNANLINYVIRLGQTTEKLASTWNIPTLLLYAGNDKIVKAEATDRFLKNATDFVEARCFSHMFHDIFREPDKHLVYETLLAWLDKRYPPYKDYTSMGALDSTFESTYL